MLARALARRFAKSGIFYGWAVAAVIFLVSVTSAGVMGLPGAFILPLGHEFGWTQEQISSALALRIFLYGIMAPFAAALMERYGLKRVILTALLINACALALASQMNQLWQLVLLFGVSLGIGTGMTALVMSAIVSTRWFSNRRGLVVGMLTASNATGQLVFLPLAAWLESRYGWRAALAPSIAGLGVAAVMVLMFLVERPSDIGLPPLGERAIVLRLRPVPRRRSVPRSES